MNYECDKLRRAMSVIAMRALLSAGLMIALFGSSACSWMKAPNKRIDEARSGISKGFQKEVNHQQYGTNKGVLNISWQQGLDRM